MMKVLGWLIAIIFAGLYTVQSLKEEGEELNYVMDSMSFLVSWRINQDYAIACNEEGKESLGDNVISVYQIQGLIDKGMMACELEGRFGVPLGVGKIFAEAVYVPIRAAIPYELAKNALEQNKSNRCSDYIKPIIQTCPILLSPYFKRVELIQTIK